MGRLFGTDGARGIANLELTCELATNIGRAAAFVLATENVKRPKVLIGKDTRASSDMLEMALFFWAGDEEFAPRMRFLWDENSLQYLRYETMHYLLGVLRQRLKEN